MELINVLNLMAEGKIKEGTKLEFDGYEYEFSEDHFEDDSGDWLEDVHEISASFLNIEVELTQPKPKKYLIKVNIKGLIKELTVLNYQRLTGKIHLGSPGDTNFVKTSFTKSEMQSIQPVREFLEDMEGKFELIEVDDNEND